MLFQPSEILSLVIPKMLWGVEEFSDIGVKTMSRIRKTMMKISRRCRFVVVADTGNSRKSMFVRIDDREAIDEILSNIN